MKYLTSFALLAALVVAEDAATSTATAPSCAESGRCADAINLQMDSCKQENLSEDNLRIGQCTCKLDANYWLALSDCITNCPEFGSKAPKTDPASLQKFQCDALLPYSSELNAGTDGSDANSTADVKVVTTTSSTSAKATGSSGSASKTVSSSAATTSNATTATTSKTTGSATGAAETETKSETSSTKNAAAALGFGSLVYLVAAAII